MTRPWRQPVGSLAVIDTTSDTVTNTVEIGLADEPTGIAFA